MNTEKINLLLDILRETHLNVYKHSERVAMLCYEFSRRFDIEKSEREVVYWAGFLHEIGKLGFESEVKIKDVIYNIDEIYPLFSKAVVMAINESRLAKIVEQHFENIDGSGFPCGLGANDIHLFATMIRLCDFYDHCRLNGLDHAESVAKIRKLTNIAFPKKMITPFVKMLVEDNDIDFYKEKL